ncbi:hypothetical protein D5400_16720 [Georhizobium profundi]|jgi:hypothetical protein|uniref:Uncharacterized protein n=2 Tax=Georhizobium profundi TaxID=2341112 RepID=A0A3Q8XQ38_9HYPH|nr:hypothetical protein D5400_16720 [Georhizobium profundi]
MDPMTDRSIKGTARVALASLGVAAASILALPVPEAAAQGLFGGPSGANCNVLQQQGGSYWQGFVRGAQESAFTGDDGINQYTDAHCFRTEAECEAWLYAAQSAAHIVFNRWCRSYAA